VESDLTEFLDTLLIQLSIDEFMKNLDWIVGWIVKHVSQIGNPSRKFHLKPSLALKRRAFH
jgi:hypothetical protein